MTSQIQYIRIGLQCLALQTEVTLYYISHGCVPSTHLLQSRSDVTLRATAYFQSDSVENHFHKLLVRLHYSFVASKTISTLLVPKDSLCHCSRER